MCTVSLEIADLGISGHIQGNTLIQGVWELARTKCYLQGKVKAGRPLEEIDWVATDCECQGTGVHFNSLASLFAKAEG